MALSINKYTNLHGLDNLFMDSAISYYYFSVKLNDACEKHHYDLDHMVGYECGIHQLNSLQRVSCQDRHQLNINDFYVVTDRH